MPLKTSLFSDEPKYVSLGIYGEGQKISWSVFLGIDDVKYEDVDNSQHEYVPPEKQQSDRSLTRYLVPKKNSKVAMRKPAAAPAKRIATVVAKSPNKTNSTKNKSKAATKKDEMNGRKGQTNNNGTKNNQRNTSKKTLTLPNDTAQATAKVDKTVHKHVGSETTKGQDKPAKMNGNSHMKTNENHHKIGKIGSKKNTKSQRSNSNITENDVITIPISRKKLNTNDMAKGAAAPQVNDSKKDQNSKKQSILKPEDIIVIDSSTDDDDEDDQEIIASRKNKKSAASPVQTVAKTIPSNCQSLETKSLSKRSNPHINGENRHLLRKKPKLDTKKASEPLPFNNSQSGRPQFLRDVSKQNMQISLKMPRSLLSHTHSLSRGFPVQPQMTPMVFRNPMMPMSRQNAAMAPISSHVRQQQLARAQAQLQNPSLGGYPSVKPHGVAGDNTATVGQNNSTQATSSSRLPFNVYYLPKTTIIVPPDKIISWRRHVCIPSHGRNAGFATPQEMLCFLNQYTSGAVYMSATRPANSQVMEFLWITHHDKKRWLCRSVCMNNRYFLEEGFTASGEHEAWLRQLQL